MGVEQQPEFPSDCPSPGRWRSLVTVLSRGWLRLRGQARQSWNSWELMIPPVGAGYGSVRLPNFFLSDVSSLARVLPSSGMAPNSGSNCGAQQVHSCRPFPRVLQNIDAVRKAAKADAGLSGN